MIPIRLNRSSPAVRPRYLWLLIACVAVVALFSIRNLVLYEGRSATSVLSANANQPFYKDCPATAPVTCPSPPAITCPSCPSNAINIKNLPKSHRNNEKPNTSNVEAKNEKPAFHDYKSELSTRATRIAVCSMVHRLHAPYLAEWIEFHLLPRVGFSHFYLYHDHKDLTTSLDQEFPLGSPVKLAVQKYIDAGVLTLRENWPPRPSDPNYEADISVSPLKYDECYETFQAKDLAMSESVCQRFTFDHCLEVVRHKKNLFEWVAVFDVDEFMWTEEHKSVDTYLKSLPPSVSQVSGSAAMFGPNGFILDEPFLVDKRRLRSFIVNALDRRRFIAEKAEIVDTNLYPVCIAETYTAGDDSGWPVCNESGKKSIIRVNAADQLKIHIHIAVATEDCKPSKETSWCRVEPPKSTLRFNHYQFRSIQDAYERYQVSKKMTTVQVTVLAGPFFDAIKDRMVADAVAVDLYGRLGWQIPTRQSWSSLDVVYGSEDRIKQGWVNSKFSTIGGLEDGQ